MSTVSLQLREKDANDKNVTTTIQYVNPAVSGAVLREFAGKLSALTNNSYESTRRIETIILDTEDFVPQRGES